MVNAVSRKAGITLFSYPLCIHNHRVRMVLHEKGIASEVDFVCCREPPEDLLELNPYGTTPTLVDRDLVLYEAGIIMEYLDERFPHPPLYPMDPVSRARARMLLHRIETDWYSLYDQLRKAEDGKIVAKAKKMLKESLIQAIPAFAAKPFFLSDEFSLVDCAVVPLLWRLPALGVDLPRQAEPVRAYARMMFERESFQASLGEEERELASVPHALAG